MNLRFLIKGIAVTAVILAATVSVATVEYRLALGHVSNFSAHLFDSAPSYMTRTIDIAGDGKNNDGYEPSRAFSQNNFGRITVNGLVICVIDLAVDTGVAPYYQSQVIHGPGAFIEVADTFEGYERAMRRKLERELAPAMIGLSGPLPKGRG